MNQRTRALLFGVAVGVAYTATQRLALDVLSPGFGASRTELTVRTALSALALLAVIPGAVAYASYRMDVSRPPNSWLAFAGIVAAGTGVGVFVANPVASTIDAGVGLGAALEPELVGPYLVNTIAPAGHAWAGALAGFLLAEQNT